MGCVSGGGIRSTHFQGGAEGLSVQQHHWTTFHIFKEAQKG